MNLLLFSSESELRHLRPGDPRLHHVRTVLRLGSGQQLYAGVLNGKRAWAKILSDDPQEGMFTEPQWEAQEPPQPLPLRVLVGLPRPQTARRILFEAAVLGVSQLDFFQAQKGEPSYAQSSLWHSGQWQERLWQGAEQACVTTLPAVNHFKSLADALAAPQQLAEVRLALDIYEAVAPLSHLLPPGLPPERQLTLAFGPERGWDATEREQLTQEGFLLTHLGQRVLRSETAFVAALSLAADRMLYPLTD